MLGLGLTTSKKTRSSVAGMIDIYKDNIVLGFSCYKLSSGYTGYCVRVRRNSDNTEADFGFSGNYINYQAIVAFCGSGNGYVTIFYNQFTGGNNAVQATTSNQPIIVNAGVFTGIKFVSAAANYLTIIDYANANITTPVLSVYTNYTPTTNHQGYIFSRSEDSLHQYSILNNLAQVTFYLNTSSTSSNHNTTANNKALVKWLSTDANQVIKNANGVEGTYTHATSPLTVKNNLIIGARHPYAVYYNGVITSVIMANTNLDYNVMSIV